MNSEKHIEEVAESLKQQRMAKEQSNDTKLKIQHLENRVDDLEGKLKSMTTMNSHLLQLNSSYREHVKALEVRIEVQERTILSLDARLRKMEEREFKRDVAPIPKRTIVPREQQKRERESDEADQLDYRPRRIVAREEITDSPSASETSYFEDDDALLPERSMLDRKKREREY